MYYARKIARLISLQILELIKNGLSSRIYYVSYNIMNYHSRLLHIRPLLKSEYTTSARPECRACEAVSKGANAAILDTPRYNCCTITRGRHRGPLILSL